MNSVYIALYKGTGGSGCDQLTDWLVRQITQGSYSHCEIAVQKSEIKDHYHREVWFECYSASPRDGGVRQKIIHLEDGKWDLIPLPHLKEMQVKAYFEQTNGQQYDWWGALGVMLGIKHKRSKFFCSEWCFNAITGSDEGWRFSPNQLAVMFRKDKKG